MHGIVDRAICQGAISALWLADTFIGLLLLPTTAIYSWLLMVLIKFDFAAILYNMCSGTKIFDTYFYYPYKISWLMQKISKYWKQKSKKKSCKK